MPQVPYNPVPTVAPTQQPIPQVREDAPIAAFGGAVGQAVESLGGDISKSGNELFSRAIALKQLDNETDAKNADAQYTIEAGKLHADYSSLEGKARVDAYPKFQSDLNELRLKLRGGLNPMAARMYDSSSLSMMSRTIFNGAGMAASAHKDYVNGAAEGQVQLAQVGAGNHWNDPEAFKQDLSRIDANIEAQAITKGWDPLKTASVKQEALGKAWYQKIATQALQDPFGARSEYEKHHDELGPYRKQLEATLEQREASGGSKVITDVLATGDYVHRLIGQESGFNIFAKAPTSSAKGLGQFTDETWTRVRSAHPELELPTSVTQATGPQQISAIKAFTADNQAVLRSKGLDPNMQNTYLAHFLGAGGAVTFLNGMKADPGQPATDLVSPAAAAANRSVFYNQDGSPRSAASVYIRMTARFAGPGALTPESSAAWLSEAEKAGSAIAKEVAPNNPALEEMTLNSIRNRFNVVRGAAKQAEQQDLLTLEAHVNGGGDPNKALNDYNQVLDNPVLSELYNRLPPPSQDKIKRMIDVNARQSPPDTFERQQNFQKIMNMSTEIGGKRDVFMQLDPAALVQNGHITRGQMNKIYAKQREVQAGMANDARHLTHALQLSKDYLKANQIISGSDEEIQFTGAMNQWLTEYEKDKQHAPTDQEIRDKAAGLTTYTKSGWFSGSYGFEPTAAFKDEFTPLFKKAPGNTSHREPTLEDIARAYQYSLSHPDWKKEIGG